MIFEDEDCEEENEITDCPHCGRMYDDADADFYICHHCGFDANENKFTNNKSRSVKMYGIDADVTLDGWS